MLIAEDGTEIEIFPRETDGKLIARASSGPYVFEEVLPDGFSMWTIEEIKAHLKRFVAPVLKTKVAKAKELKEQAVTSKDVEIVRKETRILTLEDERHIQMAEAKRAKRALRLVQ